MERLRHVGRVALVTGAGSGIGRAVALRLVAEGAWVVASDVDPHGLDETLRLAKDTGHEIATVVGDVSSQEDVDHMVGETLARHGRVDILVNNAGIMDWFLPAHEVDDETWQRVMAVNVTGPMLLCRSVLPSMMRHHDGSIVNISSIGGLGGGAAGVAYTTSKHALVGMTRSIAWTYREEGIRCNAVCPGGVDTNIGTTATPRSDWGKERLGKAHALAVRTAQPDEIAALVSWLTSAEASNVNGAIVTSDGGWRAA